LGRLADSGSEGLESDSELQLKAVFGPVFGLDDWLARWRARLASEGRATAEVRRAMDGVNPAVIPRNHKVEEALAAASAEEPDLAPFERLLEVLAHPFDDKPDRAGLDAPAPPGGPAYRTFCGT
jgi:uncharacterized protein YdiU (UPF0061 family)